MALITILNAQHEQFDPALLQILPDCHEQMLKIFKENS
jgi:hypothetical protein